MATTPDRQRPRTRAEAGAEIARRCQWKPELFVSEVLHIDPARWQVDLMRGLVDKNLAACAGGNETGKDATAAWLALWLLSTRPYAKGQGHA
jgi:hypothetical protein